MIMKTQNLTILNSKFLVLIMSLVLSVNLWAQAGTSIFTYGKVDVRQADGTLSALSRGMDLNSGDAVLTGINGRAQLRMLDGAIFDLKPNSEFIIEEYVYAGTRTVSGQVLTAEQDKGFYRLMRGGFRAISGLIGKRNKKNYRVTTPVATIGIRGTDYSAQLDSTGLYLSVASGGVVLNNNGGSLDIDPGQTGFVASMSAAPVMVGAANASTTSSNQAGDPSIEKTADNEAGEVVSLETGNELVQPVPPADPMGTPGRVAVAVNGQVEQSGTTNANLTIDSNNALESMTTSENTYAEGSTRSANQGFDPDTGLYWGRWGNGTAVVSNSAGSSDVNLDSSDAHWIYTTNQITPTVPLTGEADFNLVGNTNPTDNMGNSGVLGSASLSADFDNQTVDADVNLTINDQTWDAQADDVALDGEAATFAGDFDDVAITDNSTQTETDGSGSLEGFLTGDENNDVSGAAMSYSLSDNADTTVEGTVAFEVEESSESGSGN